jgi:type II secretory pathway pseudopilin PulG
MTVGSSRISLAIIGTLLVLLAASAFGNFQQYRRNGRLAARLAVLNQQEEERAAAEAQRVAARKQKRSEHATSDARMQELYDEIDSLSRISDRLLGDVERTDDVATTAEAPSAHERPKR